MLEPRHFELNEAWIVFQLNDTPIHTERDGDFDVMALIDAASGLILGSAFLRAGVQELSESEARALLAEGKSSNQQLPKTLFIPSEHPALNLALEAQRQDISVVRVLEDQLVLFTEEPRRAFRRRFNQSGIQ